MTGGRPSGGGGSAYPRSLLIDARDRLLEGELFRPRSPMRSAFLGTPSGVGVDDYVDLGEPPGSAREDEDGKEEGWCCPNCGYEYDNRSGRVETSEGTMCIMCEPSSPH